MDLSDRIIMGLVFVCLTWSTGNIRDDIKGLREIIEKQETVKRRNHE